MPVFKHDGLELFYEDSGAAADTADTADMADARKPPLLFLPGLGGASQLWPTVISRFEAAYRVIRLDNRGAGRSRPLDCEVSLELLATDCLALLDQLGCRQATLIGQSLGGQIALAVAGRAPERVTGLVLCASAPCLNEAQRALLRAWAAEYRSAALTDPTGTDLAQQTERLGRQLDWLLAPRLLANPANRAVAVRSSLAAYSAAAAAGYCAQAEAACALDLWASLPYIQAPCLVLAGAEDRLFPPADQEKMAARLPRGRLQVIAGAGHSLPQEQPLAFYRAVEAWLDQPN
ncbi:MAG: hypothetical protein A2087_04765 [Spirochaetes bacterium GWD1_61_31]|nr:MAG: hypothetical protein A2Y37_01695 [Spirochaetes bacterium GWB1_60_80]OHD34927.1 MAG: hypothetical protein A2004_00725 [Spirochaetes bacterium GWC1_61_12]OHD37044.1 MAG: hypothetical protein A2087_04765 [Spirochaetes bacterium GWD1_61_31]OHD45346.1 MAG: hypothetical protein A2Y35_00625 [Spirochaetes bacterium GWE1_60_18]OHD61098.1 MAG: hypothetical protein A2Y32_09310 [Spirochaetes bacterium GWF1_60_12]HAP42760.1 hypothetical protein [Spirochaetaceae bacterium]